ncbi:MAG TPA: ATP-binding cassette domain-containing protein, partial [Bacteroidales bacterium]|nr:ATP-binding cassette domain-containing protein [Bacteroidales bacterium]
NSFYLQLIAGLGFSYIASFLLWHSSQQGINAPLAIGVFFGIMAQAELSEMLFSGKSEKSSIEHQIKDINSIINDGSTPLDEVKVGSELEKLQLINLRAMIPDTPVKVEAISLNINRGEWIALYGETGKGKSTLLNSLFYPEYVEEGTIVWNDEKIRNLPIPEAIYVTQKAYLLTGTLRENFEGYSDEEIEDVLKTVDLASWRTSLAEGLGTWIGENGETLSGGQRKKLLLAQALLKQPQLLVVDEPTAGISTENAIDIFQNIQKRYPGITILMATHLKEFEKVADKVVSIL